MAYTLETKLETLITTALDPVARSLVEHAHELSEIHDAIYALVEAQQHVAERMLAALVCAAPIGTDPHGLVLHAFALADAFLAENQRRIRMAQSTTGLG